MMILLIGLTIFQWLLVATQIALGASAFNIWFCVANAAFVTGITLVTAILVGELKR